jgi:hypothetical protein
MHRTVAAALVAALALAVASCGGAEPLTRAQLVSRIEVACREGQRAVQRRGGAGKGPIGFVAAVIAGQRVVVNRIGDLKAPDASKDDFNAFKEGIKQRLALVEKVETAGRAGIPRAIRAVQTQGEVISRRIQDAGTRLGVKGCI